MNLSEGQVDKDYVVVKATLPVEVERRLQALGMTKDTLISVLNKKGKGILIVKLRRSRFALGYDITKNIEVRPFS